MIILERPQVELLYKETRVTLSFDNRWRENVIKVFHELEPADYDITVKKRKEKRSLDANAYAWVLIGKIAEVLRTNITEVYRRIISEMSAFEVVPIREDALEKWRSTWENNGLGWVTQDLGQCKNFKGYHNVKCHYGSSTFDKSEMSHFIDLIIQECKQLDIEHLPDYELERLKENWE